MPTTHLNDLRYHTLDKRYLEIMRVLSATDWKEARQIERDLANARFARDIPSRMAGLRLLFGAKPANAFIPQGSLYGWLMRLDAMSLTEHRIRPESPEDRAKSGGFGIMQYRLTDEGKRTLLALSAS